MLETDAHVLQASIEWPHAVESCSRGSPFAYDFTMKRQSLCPVGTLWFSNTPSVFDLKWKVAKHGYAVYPEEILSFCQISLISNLLTFLNSNAPLQYAPIVVSTDSQACTSASSTRFAHYSSMTKLSFVMVGPPATWENVCMDLHQREGIDMLPISWHWRRLYANTRRGEIVCFVQTHL